MTQRIYRVPALTIELGTVLEAVVLRDRKRITVTEWRGMRLLADYDAFDRERPRLYLVRAKPVRKSTVAIDQRKVDEAADGYDRWHKREAKALYELDTREARASQGRMVRLDYRSDKWHARGTNVEYTHDFTERGATPPLVYTDSKTLASARTCVVLGGQMRITERGIA